jgi:hypothetical protein
MPLDSYFYMDMNIPEDSRRMECYCVECFKELGLQNGMFWEGSTRGYGKYNVVCKKCSKEIHTVKDDTKPSEEK